MVDRSFARLVAKTRQAANDDGFGSYKLRMFSSSLTKLLFFFLSETSQLLSPFRLVFEADIMTTCG